MKSGKHFGSFFLFLLFLLLFLLFFFLLLLFFSFYCASPRRWFFSSTLAFKESIYLFFAVIVFVLCAGVVSAQGDEKKNPTIEKLTRTLEALVTKLQQFLDFIKDLLHRYLPSLFSLGRGEIQRVTDSADDASPDVNYSPDENFNTRVSFYWRNFCLWKL